MDETCAYRWACGFETCAYKSCKEREPVVNGLYYGGYNANGERPIELDKWADLKQSGSSHYKGGTEPIDLYKSGGMLHDFAIASIIKYAYRNRKELVGGKISEKDMGKIKHYADMLIAIAEADNER